MKRERETDRRSWRSSGFLAAGMAAAWLSAAPHASAQSGTTCTPALVSATCPADFNRTGALAFLAPQTTAADCTGAANQTDQAICNATSVPVACTPPAGNLNVCQSYDTGAIRDIYETLQPVGLAGFCDSDLMFVRVGGDANWFYYEWETTGAWNCDATGENRRYIATIDGDFGSEFTGGNPNSTRYDFFFEYAPKTGHIDTMWEAEGNALVKGNRDTDNNCGATDPLVSNNGDPGCPGAACDCADGDFNGTGGFPSIALADVWVRIVTILGKQRPQMAVRRSLLASPTEVRSCLWSYQSGTLDKNRYPWHDGQPLTELPTQRFDNACGVGRNNELYSSSTGAVPVTLSYFRAERRGGETSFEWSTDTEAGNVGFNIYVETARGFERVNSAMIPAKGGDSLAPQDYSYAAKGVRGGRFEIADVDIHGGETRHGPFALGEEHGLREPVEEIDWRGIRAAKQSEKSARRASSASASSASAAGARLGVARDGLYRVTYEALRSAGVELAGAPLAEIALTNRGVPQPITVRGSKGGSFGPGGHVEFYGRAEGTLYTRTNVYVLSLDRALARRATVDSARPKGKAPATYVETVKVDRNLAYGFSSPNGDPWYEARLLAQTAPVSQSYTFAVDQLAPGASTLNLGLWGGTDWPASPDHHVEVDLNGARVADVRFDGLADLPLAIDLSSGLREGTNTIRVTLPADSGVPADIVHVDRYGAAHPRRFRARDGKLAFDAAAGAFQVGGLPAADVVVYRSAAGKLARLSAVEVSGANGAYAARFAGSASVARYLVSTVGALGVPSIAPARPRTDITSGEARYLILTHGDFVDGIAPLAQARGGKVVDVADVYAQFGGGVFDPSALRDYLAYAASAMGTRSVLLVGGDTYDYHDYLGLGSISFVPTLYAKTHPVVNYAPVDALLADVDEDGVPDLEIGRLPVRTGAELDAVVGKTLGFASAPHARTAVFAADREFGDESDAIAAELADWSLERAHIDELGVAGARGTLIGAVNSGRALTSYFGHSGPTIWTFSGLFSAADAAALTNAGAPTVVTQWGCWNTYHVSPAYNTMAHKFLLSGDNGAAAVLGASSLTDAVSDRKLGELIMRGLAKPGTTIGSAVAAAKRDLAAAEPGLVDVILGWTLLGDPDLVVSP